MREDEESIEPERRLSIGPLRDESVDEGQGVAGERREEVPFNVRQLVLALERQLAITALLEETRTNISNLALRLARQVTLPGRQAADASAQSPSAGWEAAGQGDEFLSIQVVKTEHEITRLLRRLGVYRVGFKMVGFAPFWIASLARKVMPDRGERPPPIRPVSQQLALAMRLERDLERLLAENEAEILELKTRQVSGVASAGRRREDLPSEFINSCSAGTSLADLAVQQLIEKQRSIREIEEAIGAYRMALEGAFLLPIRVLSFPFRHAAQWVQRSYRLAATPGLGNLRQYAPRDLKLPVHYSLKAQLTAAPKVSIVTPSYNQGPFIERTLESVLGQTYPNLEYFVQDGGSVDETVAILERYSKRLSGWVSQPDRGQTHAINLGFARTSGEIMAWLNSDDILLPGALAYIVEFFNQHPEVDVVYGHRILIDEQDKEIGRWVLPAHSDEVLSWADFVPQETLFWRRAMWEKVGGRVDESFRFAMDWDLLLRFRDRGARMACLPRFIGAFRVHESQKTSANIRDIGKQEMDRLRQRSLGRMVDGAEIRRALVPYMLKALSARITQRLGEKLTT